MSASHTSMESPPRRSTNTRHTSCLQDNVVFSRTGMFSLYVKVTFCLPFPFLRESFKGRCKFRTPMELDRNAARINRNVSSVFQKIISSSVHIFFFLLIALSSTRKENHELRKIQPRLVFPL